MSTILYGAPLSPFVRKVAVFLEEKSVPYAWVPARPHDRNPDFQAISPLGKIPAYKDERIALADSSVICMYLEKTHAAPPLYPSETLAFARALWFEEYADSGMVDSMSDIYFEKFFNPTYRGMKTDEARLKDATEVKTPPLFAYLESQLPASGWMVGPEFSIADIGLTVGFWNLQAAGFVPDEARYPKLTAYVQRAYLRPSFKKINARAVEFLATVKAKS